MTNPSPLDYWEASDLTYDESNSGGVETQSSLPTEATLISDQETFLFQQNITGWTPIAVQYLPSDGFYAAAYLTNSGQIIIAFEGTVNSLSAPAFSLATDEQDEQIDKLIAPSSFAYAEAFAASVLADALTLGVASTQVFVTGHSLGGAEAEYVSWQSGLSGAAFGAPGVPGYEISGFGPPQPSFVNYVDYGDPVGNYASQMPVLTGEPGFAPFSGITHVGTVDMVGLLSNEAALNTAAANAYTPLFGWTFLQFHYLDNYATDLGFTPLGPLGSVTPATTTLSPGGVLEALDSQLGTLGQTDLSSAILTSTDEIQSPNFTITINPDPTITITQNQTLADDSGSIAGPLGTDVVTLDPTTLDVVTEVFTSSATDAAVELLPDVAYSDDSQNVTFGGTIDVVAIENSASFAGTISNLTVGDTIDLVGVSATGAELGANNVLNVYTTDGTTVSLSFDPATDYSENSFQIAPDGNGGSDITLSQLSNNLITIVETGVVTQVNGPLGIVPSAAGQPFSVTTTFFSNSAANITQFGADLYYLSTGSTTFASAGFSLEQGNVGEPDSFLELRNGDISVGSDYPEQIGATITEPGVPNPVTLQGSFTTSGMLGTALLHDFTEAQYQGVNDVQSIYGNISGLTIETQSSPACFADGTHINTDRGEIVVEHLMHGDLVLTHFSSWVPIKWIGYRQIDCARHPQPHLVWPIRVRAGTFGDGMPHRDLWLSPDHAVFVDDVLIPIKRLINGISIEQVPMEEVTYYHIELPQHDVLLAEGLPAESYLDTGDRCNFANGSGPIMLYPDFAARRLDTALMWEALGCAPLIVTGPGLDAVRQQVNARVEVVVQQVAAQPDSRLAA